MGKVINLGIKINYLWRLVGTGLCFAGFGIGAIFLVYFVIPSIGKKKARSVISTSFNFFISSMQKCGILRFEFRNLETLQRDHGCLLVSNHPTLLDYVFIVSKLKSCNTIVKQALWQNMFLKKIIKLANYIPNRTLTEIFPLIKASLQGGDNLLIFPEGTRSEPNKPIKLQRGAAQIALRLQAPIRIIKISCSPSTLTKNEKWYNIPPQKPTIIVEAGELIDTTKFLQNTKHVSLAARSLTNYLTKSFTE